MDGCRMDEYNFIQHGWKVVYEISGDAKEAIIGIYYDPITKQVTALTESGKVINNISVS